MRSPAESHSVKAALPWLGWAAVIALLAFGHLPTFRWMVERFDGADSYYGHGYLIPPVTAFLLYARRKDWLGELGRLDKPCLWVGCILLTAALAMNVMGHLLTVFFLLGLSLVVSLVGIGVVTMNVRKPWTAGFPLLYLFFMVPLPHELLETLSIPLKHLVARSSVAFVDFLGIPALLNGFEVSLKWGPVVVGNPCSGLRSLVALAAMGTLVAYLGKLNAKGRILVVLLTIPAAIVCNFLRVSFLLLFAHSRGLDSIVPGSAAHDFSGYVLFAVALVLLLSLAKMMEKWAYTRS